MIIISMHLTTRVINIKNVFFSYMELNALDYMHLVCLGVVRRVLYGLKDGPRVFKLSQNQLALMPSKLTGLRNQIPSELARQPRSLSDLKDGRLPNLSSFCCILTPRVFTGRETYKGN